MVETICLLLGTQLWLLSQINSLSVRNKLGLIFLTEFSENSLHITTEHFIIMIVDLQF